MPNNEDFLVAKTISSVYPVWIDPSETSPGYFLNLALFTEVIVKADGTIFVKLLNDRSYILTGNHAHQILDELRKIQMRYQ